MREKLVDLRSQKSQSESLSAQLEGLKSGLLIALDAAGASRDQKQPLSLLIKTAQTYMKIQRDLESRMASADKELANLKAELEEGTSTIADLDGSFSKWRTSWEKSVQKIGIRADASPTAALAVIENVREVRNKTGEADVLRKRIEGIDRDSEEFITRVGSTMHVNFHTSKTRRWKTDPRRCHINWAILDGDWEGELCRVVESHPKVKAYVKNQGLGFEVPYRMGSVTRRYIPDFIVLIDDGRGDDDLLHLIVEIKGYRGEDAKIKKETMEVYWIPGVNHLGDHGRWVFAELTDVYLIESDFEAKLEAEFNKLIDQALNEKRYPGCP